MDSRRGKVQTINERFFFYNDHVCQTHANRSRAHAQCPATGQASGLTCVSNFFIPEDVTEVNGELVLQVKPQRKPAVVEPVRRDTAADSSLAAPTVSQVSKTDITFQSPKSRFQNDWELPKELQHISAADRGIATLNEDQQVPLFATDYQRNFIGSWNVKRRGRRDYIPDDCPHAPYGTFWKDNSYQNQSVYQHDFTGKPTSETTSPVHSTAQHSLIFYTDNGVDLVGRDPPPRHRSHSVHTPPPPNEVAPPVPLNEVPKDLHLPVNAKTEPHEKKPKKGKSKKADVLTIEPAVAKPVIRDHPPFLDSDREKVMLWKDDVEDANHYSAPLENMDLVTADDLSPTNREAHQAMETESVCSTAQTFVTNNSDYPYLLPRQDQFAPRKVSRQSSATPEPFALLRNRIHEFKRPSSACSMVSHTESRELQRREQALAQVQRVSTPVGPKVTVHDRASTAERQANRPPSRQGRVKIDLERLERQINSLETSQKPDKTEKGKPPLAQSQSVQRGLPVGTGPGKWLQPDAIPAQRHAAAGTVGKNALPKNVRRGGPSSVATSTVVMNSHMSSVDP